jgi:DNA polymerase-3 subunit delta'
MSQLLNNFLLHPRTKSQIELLLRRPAHATLICGPAGSGKKTLAKAIASELLGIQKLEDYPYFMHVSKLKNKHDISIDQVREIIESAKLKIPGNKEVQRVIIIDDAQNLSIPAQNALLKILEEPNDNTVFLLGVSLAQEVLPTIISRTRSLDVLPVTLEQAEAYFGRSYTSEQLNTAWQLSGGLTGLLTALLLDDQSHPLKEAVKQSRLFLGSKTYDRLRMMESLSRDKQQLNVFFEALARIFSHLHHSAISSNKDAQAAKISKSRKLIQRSQDALRLNTNAKIVCLNFTINLRV